MSAEDPEGPVFGGGDPVTRTHRAGNLFRLFDDAHRDRLARRIGGVLGQARKEVQLRQLCPFFRADEDYGRRVAEQLGVGVSEFTEHATPEPVG